MVKCKNCDGKGGWAVGEPCSFEDMMWIDDGECMRIGFMECYWCKGEGEISEEREAEMLEKKKHLREKCE